ncbi:enoyl-CoA hydratase domain-containing protein 2, mitochondrial isoform X2 [Zootoca vivipara]|uniref:enoyl-CoA hydratase domain-containing protein 2, mitochondrial isoform X2 n=1 Tax=Zootoca vivipara TaxID=8524 RepID=UPI00293BF1B2|nr:enoyl-CoA hydratase domain-containing protein 2, mitochondrial isoform X2 [Zootoca vivipara]
MLRLGRTAALLRTLPAQPRGERGNFPRRAASAGRQKQILLEVHGEAGGGIAEILMNRPHARNSLGKVLVDELFETLEVLHFDESIRVVIIKSKVKGVFCAGADLKERAKMSNTEADHFVQRLRSLMDGIAALPMPTIAAIEGHALGGGLELALACDLRVAGGTQRLPRCIGLSRAKELIFTGRQIDGQEAFSIGLVNHAVPQNEEGDAAYQSALALAGEIVPRAPIAVKMGKVAINKGSEVDIASGMAIERMCYAQNIPTRDREEGMAAFIEKRPPKFIGK